MKVIEVSDKVVEFIESDDDNFNALAYGSVFAANKIHRSWKTSPPLCNDRAIKHQRIMVGTVARTKLCKHCFPEYAR